MSTGRIACWAILAATLAAVPAAAQNWPSNKPAAGPGQFPPANSPNTPPAQPGPVPPPSQWGSNAPQHPAWGGGNASRQQQHPAWGGGGAPVARPGAQSGPPGQLPCSNEFMPLRDDAQAKSVLVKTAMDKKADRGELCKAFRTFSAAEAKMVKFVKDHSARCGFPDEVGKVTKANHSKTVSITNRVCNAAGPAGAPPPPSLSDALGTSRIPDSSNVKTGKGGTFDTLGGSAIAR